MLNIVKRVENGRAVIALEGRLNTNTAGELENELKTVIDSVDEIVLDLEKLAYISSSGLRVLLSAHKIMLKQGQMKVIHTSEIVKEVFDVTGFSDILNIE